MLPWGIRLWGVEFHGSLLHNCFHFSLSLQIFLASSHFSPFASRAFLTSSIHVFLGLLLFDFPSSFASCTFPASLSSLILVTCPSHLNCPRCAVTSIDSTFCSSLHTSFLILSNPVLFFILLRNIISALFVLLLCLSFVIRHSHEWTIFGFTTLLTTSAFTSCGISILLSNDAFIALHSFLSLISSLRCLDCWRFHPSI